MTIDNTLGMSIPCADCGGDILPRDKVNGYWDGEWLKCDDCGSSNQVYIDDDGDDGDVYFSRYKCKHDLFDDEFCDQCESDAGGSP